MQMKNELRKVYRAKRKNISEKAYKDSLIAQQLLNCSQYKNARQVLCYASLDDEICTDAILAASLRDGKKTALPFCTDFNGNMEFYYINSLDDIALGSYGIREPIINRCERVTDFSKSVIIVPAFTFDKNGYRLGYGKGYYDKFLKKFTFISIGLCYNDFLNSTLPIDEHDEAVDFIVTENNLFTCRGG